MATRPTIHDVAQLSMVSTKTVSIVLNQKPGVSAATRKRVVEAAGQLGYVQHPAARTLRRGHSCVVVLSAERAYDPVLSASAAELATVLRDTEYRMLTLPSATAEMALSVATELRPFALIHLGHMQTELQDQVRSAGIKRLCIGPDHGLDLLALEREIGAVQAEHLVAAGAEALALAAGDHPDFARASDARMEGLRAMGSSLGVHEVFRVDVLDGEIDTAGLTGMSRGRRIGVAGHTDLDAMAALAAQHDLGNAGLGASLHRPAMVVIGAGDSIEGRLTRPVLRSVRWGFALNGHAVRRWLDLASAPADVLKVGHRDLFLESTPVCTHP